MSLYGTGRRSDNEPIVLSDNDYEEYTKLEKERSDAEEWFHNELDTGKHTDFAFGIERVDGAHKRLNEFCKAHGIGSSDTVISETQKEEMTVNDAPIEDGDER